MKLKLIFWSLLLCCSGFSQINQEIEDPKHEQMILIDEIDKSGLQEGEYNTWFTPEYEGYTIDPQILNQLNAQLEHQEVLKIMIFIGTWCQDSQEQLPRFYKIIDQLETNVELKVYGLDAFKTCPSMNVPDYNIELVPTFIFYSKDIEIGRIIETPEVTLEADFLSIIKTGSK